MIKEIEKIEEISGVFSPLIPRIFSAYRYKTGGDNAWKQITEDGKITTLISSVDGNFTLIATKQTDFEELKEFIGFMGCSSILSNVPVTSSPKNQYSLFKFCGEETKESDFDFLSLDSISTVTQYREFYSLLFSDLQIDFDNWYCDFSKRIVNGDAVAVALTQSEKLVSVATTPMIYENKAIISGVFTLNDFRNKGYSKATIYKLIEKLKEVNVKEIYLWCEKELEEFYCKLGFIKTGNVYLETEL